LYNINLSVVDLQNILIKNDWYTLQIPSSELEIKDFAKVVIWQEIALTLLKLFIEREYNYQKNRYFSDKIEVAIMDSTHPNFFSDYSFLVKKSEERLIEKLTGLKEVIRKKEFKENYKIELDFDALFAEFHLYQPLFYIDKGKYEEVVKLQPVQLNNGEKNFVDDLKAFTQKEVEYFKDKQLYLLRNLSKRGIGFFEANNFFPDFILWLVTEAKQFVSFIDPKGLRQIQGLTDPKIQLHKNIRNIIQPKLNDPDIELNSFIVSNTPYNQLSHWKGQESIQDFNSNHVLFQKEQREYYVQIILKTNLWKSNSTYNKKY